MTLESLLLFLGQHVRVGTQREHNVGDSPPVGYRVGTLQAIVPHGIVFDESAINNQRIVDIARW